MKKDERSVYVSLAEVIGASLCTFCSYGSYQREGCCQGYSECQHPIEELSWENKHEEMLEPGGDCYGFRSLITVEVSADLVGAVLSQGYDEWFYRQFSRQSVTVYGRSFDRGVEATGKVKIG